MKKVSLPKGFNPIAAGGQFAPSHDFRLEKICTGALLAVRKTTFDKGKKDERTVRIATIKTAKGERSVWESAGNRALFDVKKGTQVFVQYIGMKKLKGKKNAMREFVVAVKGA